MALSGITIEERSQFEQMILASQTDKLVSAQLLSALSDAKKTRFIQYLSQKVDKQCQDFAELESFDGEMDAEIAVLEHCLAFHMTETDNKKISAW